MLLVPNSVEEKTLPLLHGMLGPKSSRQSGVSLNCVRCNGKSLEISQQVAVTECISMEKRTNEQGVGFLVHRMSPNFKRTHDSTADSKPFQHNHLSGVCTDIHL